MTTTKLIQELVGLCVEKGVDFEYFAGFKIVDVQDLPLINLSHNDDAPAQLQAAIDKIKEL